ncbi:MAG: flagellar protein FlgN [Sulfuricella sp.]|nr:flagellar protein FlgN [Sulfuricella sp.]
MNANPSPRHSDFASLVAAEFDEIEKFSQILESEQQALKQGEIDKLPEIARSKSEYLVKLSQLGSARDNHLKLNGIGTDATSLKQFIQREDPGSHLSLQESWDKLLASAKRAQELNQLNGAMIETLLKHNQQALAILQDAAQQNGLYGPDGHSRSIGSGRQLGKI